MLKKVVTLFVSMVIATSLWAKPASVIESEANAALAIFKTKPGAAQFLSQVKGYLIFPSVIKGGFVVAGEYGEGVLRVNGQTKAYYSIGSASLGFQAGVQEASYLIAFVSQRALDNFMKSDGWEAGVDGTITLVTWGGSKDISSISYEKPIYGFVFDSKGLMGGISLEGTKFTRIIPQ
jgi:lipid-binding SYLF domain-containing protein